MLINGKEEVEIKNLRTPEEFTHYSQTNDDVYGNLQADFPKKQYQGFNKVYIFDKEDKK